MYININPHVREEQEKRGNFMSIILETKDLTKRYGSQKAVDHVSLHVKKGQIYGFIGRNGAGKTTFLKMISGLAAPTEGEISLFGYKGREYKAMLNRLGILIESPGVYPDLTAYDNIKLKCICTGIKEKEYNNEILKLVRLDNTGKKKVKRFSLGMKQRLGIALAIVGEPDILVLDEPINGLDPQGIAEIRETILRLNQERNMTILISSHILGELSKIATHYGIIHQGQLLQELTREELMEKCREHVELRLENPRRACPVLDRIGIQNYSVIDQETIYIYDYPDSSEDLMEALALEQIYIKEIKMTNEDLETYFLSLTGGI